MGTEMISRSLSTAGVLAVALTCAGGAVLAQAPPPFTLADALGLARRESPEAAAARARVAAAREAVDAAAWWPNPVAEFRTENLASGVSRSVLPLDTFAEVTQVVELGGKRGARRGLAAADAGQAEAAAAVLDARLALDIARDYLDAVRLRERQRSSRPTRPT
ncbi:MAG: TolC family protein [Vicinamibacterales bacterium]